MNYNEPARTTTHRNPGVVVTALLVLIAAFAAVLGYQTLAPSSSTAVSPPVNVVRNDRPALGETGRVGDDVTVFDDTTPAVTRLDPDLLDALRRAATDAAAGGIEFYVNSGWRSEKYQEQLFDQAVAKYGSKEKAARWVALPGTSAHESGDAVDLGSGDATAWLSWHGASYGLCQIYANEPWHYELRPKAVTHGCPAMYADPTHDPRMPS